MDIRGTTTPLLNRRRSSDQQPLDVYQLKMKMDNLKRKYHARSHVSMDEEGFQTFNNFCNDPRAVYQNKMVDQHIDRTVKQCDRQNINHSLGKFLKNLKNEKLMSKE